MSLKLNLQDGEPQSKIYGEKGGARKFEIAGMMSWLKLRSVMVKKRKKKVDRRL